MPELASELELVRMLENGRDDEAVDTDSPTRVPHLTVRCPHCGQTVRLSSEACLENIVCGSCGSRFGLEVPETQGVRGERRLGHFELIEKVGSGSFGAVWKARDTQLDRIVAVKVPRQVRLDADELEQFVREARAAAQLNHPHIVSVHEVGRDEDTVYIVSDFVDGTALSDWLTGHNPTFREAAQLCAKIAAALEHAHQAGVIHRDLKPQNIMLDAQGEPHLTDFGLARRDMGEITVTVDGRVLGTPAYMSPEQARGEAHRADRRADIYSLGAILFELLTGELPFRGNARMMLHQALHEEAPSPRRLNSSIPKDLETICLKCLEKEPGRRYDAARTLAEELGRFRRGEPIQTRPISPVARAWRWCKRRPAVAALSASVAILLLLLAVTGPLVAIRESRFAAAESAARKQADRAQEAERRLTSGMAFDRGLALCDQGHVGRGLLWLARALELAPSDETDMQRAIRANLNAWRRELNSLEAIFPHGQGVINVAFSPNGQLILTASKDKTAQLWDLRTGERVGEPMRHDGDVHEVVFSPDGSRILTANYDNTARLWETETGKHLQTFRHQGLVPAAAFSPDGLRFVTGSSDGAVQIWDADSGEPIGELPKHPHMVHDVAISSDGSKLLTACHDRNVRLWDFDTHQLIATFKHDARVPTADFCQPDGSQFVTSDSDGNVYLWDVKEAVADDDKRLETAAGQFTSGPWRHQGGIHRVRVSPDGARILTGSFDNTAQLLDAKTLAAVGTPFEHQAAVSGVAFSPDGSRIVTACEDNAARLWRPAVGQSLRMVNYETSGDHEAVFTADGRYILTKSDPETALVRDAANGTRIALLAQPGGIRAVAVSPDGSRILTGNANGTAQIWDASTGKPSFPAFHHAGGVWAVALSDDGQRMLAGGMRGTVQLRDVVTGALIGAPLDLGARVLGVAFSPNGSRMAVASGDKMVRIFDTNMGNFPRRLAGHRDTVVAVAFSRDGKHIVTGGYDNTVRVWDVATGRPVSKPMRHKGPIWYHVAVAFSPDGQSVVTGCDDRTVRIWDVATAKPIGPALTHEAGVRMAAFRPGDRCQVVTGTAVGTVRFWDATILPLKEDVRRITLWIQVATGFELDTEGSLNILDLPTWQQRRLRLREIGGPPGQ